MDPAASKEAVMHHAMDKEKKNDCQDDYKQELSDSERGWFFSFRVRRIRVSCHHILSARSGAYLETAVHRIHFRVAVQTASLLPPGVHRAAFAPYNQAVIRSKPDLT